jgi:tRNA pseudouridine55 synthase
VIATQRQRPTDAEIEAALAGFRGDILQVPPQYSAVKVDGERAYDLAREGEVMDLAARPLWVERLEMLAAPMPTMSIWRWSAARAAMSAPSRATLGRRLGCLGHVEWLRRNGRGRSMPIRA